MSSHPELNSSTPPSEIQSVLPQGLPTSAESAGLANKPVIPESRLRRLTRGAVKTVGGLALTTYLLTGGEQQADAEVHVQSTKPAVTAEANPSSSNESGWDWASVLGAAGTGVAIVTAGAGVVALRKQTKENIENRFTTAERDLGEIDDKTTGEQRGARLRALGAFTERSKYETRVFDAAREYLLGRRSGIENLKTTHLGPPNPEKTGQEDPAAKQALERAITERRYADRHALKLFLKTLPAARKAAANRAHKSILSRSRGDEFADLAAATGAEQDQSDYEVAARGINLDNMRGIERVNLSKLDMTGAGLKYDNLTLVDFSGSSLRETHLRKSVIAHSNLKGTDLRAAYFNGAVIRDSLIDAGTQMGELPDTHTKAKLGGLDHANMDKKRGNGEVVLSNLKSDDLSEDQIIELVKEWQRNGIKLQAGSDHKYFLNPEDDPNWSGASGA